MRFPFSHPLFPLLPFSFQRCSTATNGWSRQAMLAAGPKLQDAIDAMHSLQPVSDLFRSQVGDRVKVPLASYPQGPGEGRGEGKPPILMRPSV